MNRLRAIVSAAVVLCALACGPAFAQNWPTFAGSASRLGVNPTETQLTAATVASMRMHWKRSLDGSTETQLLYIQGLNIAGKTHDEVFATTRKGTVYALNAITGAINWHTTLPLSVTIQNSCVPAGFGIMGTPTIDPVAGIMYVVDGQGNVHALNILTGAEMPNYPVQVIDSANLAKGSFNHSSPTLVGTVLYITTSGRGPCENSLTPYQGAVIAFDTQLAAVTGTFFSLSGVNTAIIGGGGIWGPGGALFDSVTGNLYVGTGNVFGTKKPTPLAVSVVALSPALAVVGYHSPGKPLLNPVLDLDFASTPVPIDVTGCQPLLAVMNKNGNIFLYQRNALASGPVQTIEISTGGGNSAFLGMAAFDPATQMLFINNPQAPPDGSVTNGGVAYAISAPACQLVLAWQTTYGTNVKSSHTRATDPTVAGGLVWMVTGLGDSILALSETTGEPLWVSPTGTVTGPPQTPVTVANGQMFVQVAAQVQAWGL